MARASMLGDACKRSSNPSAGILTVILGVSYMSYASKAEAQPMHFSSSEWSVLSSSLMHRSKKTMATSSRGLEKCASRGRGLQSSSSRTASLWQQGME